VTLKAATCKARSCPRRRQWRTRLQCCTARKVSLCQRCALLGTSLLAAEHLTCKYGASQPQRDAQVLTSGGKRLLEPLSLCDSGLEPGQSNLVTVEASRLSRPLPLQHSREPAKVRGI